MRHETTTRNGEAAKRRTREVVGELVEERFEIIKAGAPDAPPEQALYRIQQTYPDGSGGRLNVDWDGLRRLHELIQERIGAERQLVEE